MATSSSKGGDNKPIRESTSASHGGGGNESTFGRSLMKYVKQSLPYSGGYDAITDIAQLNPKYKDFYKTGTNRDELIQRQSIFTGQRDQDGSPMGAFAVDKNYNAFMYANVDYDKSKRLKDYRVMAQFAEVADAMDEICDECINRDDRGKVVNIEIVKEDLNPHLKKELTQEFTRFCMLYQLEDKGWQYFRQLLVDGELFFEHVIHGDHANAGILGVLSVPSELIDPIYDNVQNLSIKAYLLRKPVTDSGQKTTAQASDGSGSSNKQIEHIPFDKNQLTYIHSGIWNETKTLRLPFIENARRSYRQLSLIEDAIIIYRLVRAPERLVFNVDVGNMPPPKAEAYLKKLMQSYWAKKTYDSSQAKTVQAYNPHSMLDAFWFAKRAGSEGTSVTSLQGGANLGELEDLRYFQQKLYKALKVPVERLNPEAQSDAGGATLMREELKFARFIIRLQQGFAAGLKAAFISNLKLKELWKELELREHDFHILFNPPPNFQELRNQQIYELKWGNYTTAIQNPLIADTYAKTLMLRMTDEEISKNRELLRKDSALKWELAQIEAQGPNWRDAFDAAADAESAGGMDMGGGMPPPPPGGDLGGGMPPDFGPVPPAEGAPEAPAPVEGGDTALPQ